MTKAAHPARLYGEPGGRTKPIALSPAAGADSRAAKDAGQAPDQSLNPTRGSTRANRQAASANSVRQAAPGAQEPYSR